jgi:hypothetical protein
MIIDLKGRPMLGGSDLNSMTDRALEMKVAMTIKRQIQDFFAL